MQEITITVDRVFDVVRVKGDDAGPAHTLFGFEAGQVRCYGMQVSDWPTIEPGMIITALFEKEGDWHTLLGWFNHRTGELVSVNSGGISYFIGLLGVIAAAIIYGLLRAEMNISFGAFLFLAFALWPVLSWVQHRKINKRLSALVRNPDDVQQEAPQSDGKDPSAG